MRGKGVRNKFLTQVLAGLATSESALLFIVPHLIVILFHSISQCKTVYNLSTFGLLSRIYHSFIPFKYNFRLF